MLEVSQGKDIAGAGTAGFSDNRSEISYDFEVDTIAHR